MLLHHQELILFWYRSRIINQFEESILRSSYENVKYLQKGKRGLYFEIFFITFDADKKKKES
ncbi:hypothetical protein WKT22_00561 [Candidatus Lokiarchaeum ossiferum]